MTKTVITYTMRANDDASILIKVPAKFSVSTEKNVRNIFEEIYKDIDPTKGWYVNETLGVIEFRVPEEILVETYNQVFDLVIDSVYGGGV